ncbi:MAG: hypothetical protein MUF80_11605 [Burkholderiales bacterium]|nr:hypothetical protein [Burkholderiales bacterium]
MIDGLGRLTAMLYHGQDATVRTDIVIPSPSWRNTYNLGSAQNLSVSRGEVSTWRGVIPMDAARRLQFTQTVRESEGRVVIAVEYQALNDLTAEGLFFRVNIPWIDFKGGTAGNGLRSITLPENGPNNANLQSGETNRLDARAASGGVWWNARLNRPFFVNLQDKSGESPKSFTYWVYVHRGNIAAGTAGSFEIELAIDGVPDSTSAALTVDTSNPRYRFDGFGGNYCFQIESPVTAYTLEHLDSRWARTEMTMVDWEPENENASAAETDWDRFASRDRPGTRLRREFELMQTLQRKGIPFVASIWRLPEWLLADRGVKGPNDQKRVIDPQMWDELLESLGAYMLYARDKYGVEPDLFSFNEPDLGVRILFTDEEHRDAVRRIGAHFASLGLKTKMLLGDVANARGTHQYVLKAAADPEVMKYAGAISFHSWGGASQQQYEAWANLADELGLPLLVAELGTDPSGWQGRSYDSYWYGIEELRLYQELLLHARPRGTMYWEFTADYSLVQTSGAEIAPTGRFWLTKHLTNLTPPGAEVLAVASDHPKVLLSAFRKDDAFTIHIANLSAGRVVKLTGLPARVAAWKAVMTTETEGFKDQPDVTAEDGGVVLDLPARSLLTLVYRP